MDINYSTRKAGKYSFWIWIVLLILSVEGMSQTYPQLRLKLGAVKTFASPCVSEGYAYKARSVGSPYPVLGLEYSKPMNKKRRIFFTGISMDIQAFDSSPNFKNFESFVGGASNGLRSYVLRFYAGFEQRIGKKETPSYKNYFSVFAGLGLTLNPFGGDGEGPFGTSPDSGTTKDGRQFQSPYTGSSLAGPYSQLLYVKRKFISTPTIFGGLRWHIRNKKGNDALVVELLGNYGLGRYYNYYMPYTLDGVKYTDALGEKGVCVQLNLLIPLHNFGKKKRK